MITGKSDDSSGRFFVQTSCDESLDFINRQKSVFEKLDAVLNKNETSIKAQVTPKRKSSEEENKSNKKQRYDTRQFQGKESIFKRPEAPPPSRFVRNIPAYVRNPEKWTKYTLSDVSQEDMSDRSNTAAAMSFLKELKAKKEYESMDIDGDAPQITFRKPFHCGKEEKAVGINGPTCSMSDSPSFRGSKVLLPEYVVGEKKIPKRISIEPKEKKEKTKLKEVKLDHLLEDDEF